MVLIPVLCPACGHNKISKRGKTENRKQKTENRKQKTENSATFVSIQNALSRHLF